MSKLERLIAELCPNGVEYNPLEYAFDILAGGDVPKECFSETKTDEYSIPILSNGIENKSLYGWTNKAKIEKPSLTISARGTIGWTSYRDYPFYPIVRLLVITPKVDMSLKYAYHFMKSIENDYNVPKVGIPQLTKPMIQNIQIPLPPLLVQEEIVRILDSFTELTAELTAELAARKKQYEYYRDSLLTFGDGMSMVTLGEIATDMYRGAGIKRDEITEDGIPCVRYGEIYTRYNIWFDTCYSKTHVGTKTFSHGDLLFAITGESVEEIAKSCVYMGNKTCFAGGDIVVMKHNQNPKYLSYALSTFDAQMQKGKGRIKSKVVHSSIPALKDIKIFLPPLAEQQRIVDILDRFDTLCNDISVGLPAEIAARRQQYEYYRDKLLTFKNIAEQEA